MNRSLISLYVLLTSPMPVLWIHLTKGAAIVLVYTVVLQFEHIIGINPVNFAVLAGLLWTLSPKLPELIAKDVDPVYIGTIALPLSAAILFAPSALLPYIIAEGYCLMAIWLAVILRWDQKFLENMGWSVNRWGSPEGQSNAVKWNIVRLVTLATGNAYAALHGMTAEWIVTYAALPVIVYAIYHWTILATHPYQDDTERG